MSGELPEGWTETTLGDVASWVSATVDPRNHPDQSFFYVSLEDVRSGHGSHRVQEETLGRDIGSSKLQFEPGDVLYSKLRPYLRKAFIAERSGLSVTDLIPLRPSEGLEAKFLLHHLLGPRHLDYIEPLMAGINLPRLRKGDVLGMPLRLPPLNEQRRIVAKLDALQSHSRKARAALDAIPSLLDRFRQSVLAAAFRGDLTADWRAAHPDVEPASALIARIRVERKKRWIADYIDTMTDRARKRAEKKGKPWTDADAAKARKGYAKKAAEKYQEPAPVDAEKEGLPELPEGWCWASVEELSINLSYGTSAKSARDGEVPVLRMGNMQAGEIDWSDLKFTSDPDEIEKYRLKPNSVLFNRTNSPEWVGKTALYRGEREAIYAGYLIHVDLAPGLSPVVFNYIMAAPRVRHWCKQNKSDGVSQSNISASTLSTLRVPLLPDSEQVALAATLEGLLRAGAMFRAQAEGLLPDLNRLDQSILAKAFRGELVPQDPTDEPAADLLARIQKERKGSGRR